MKIATATELAVDTTPQPRYTMGVTRNLDCNTKKGQKFIESQRETGWLIERLFHVVVKHTADDAEKFDCHIYRGGLIGLGEIKTRPYFNRKLKTACTLDRLRREGYLITAEKLDILREHSIKSRVTSYLFVNLPNDRKLLVFKISNGRGSFFTNFERRRTTTKYSCNDYKGDTIRENAFIPIEGNKHFKSYDY